MESLLNDGASGQARIFRDEVVEVPEKVRRDGDRDSFPFEHALYLSGNILFRFGGTMLLALIMLSNEL